MRNRKHPITEDVYDWLREHTPAEEFTVGDVREKMPWIKSKNISAALFHLSKHGVVSQVDRMLNLPGRPWLWAYNPHRKQVHFSTGHQDGLKRNRPSCCPSNGAASIPLTQDERVRLLLDKMLDFMSEVGEELEALKLYAVTDAEVAREYHKRKKAKENAAKEKAHT